MTAPLPETSHVSGIDLGEGALVLATADSAVLTTVSALAKMSIHCRPGDEGVAARVGIADQTKEDAKIFSDPHADFQERSRTRGLEAGSPTAVFSPSKSFRSLVGLAILGRMPRTTHWRQCSPASQQHKPASSRCWSTCPPHPRTAQCWHSPSGPTRTVPFTKPPSICQP